MIQRDSGQDFDPKHRIIGAVVVVTLAVIFIPMILGERATSFDPRESTVGAPAEVEGEATKVVVTKVGGAAAPVSGSAVANKPTPPRAPAGAPVKPEPATAPVAAAAKARPAPAESGASAESWVVQVGTFSNTANATRLEEKLRADGEAVLAERITLAGGGAVRLRVGPFRDRAAATRAQERIQRDLGVKGVVLAYP